MYNYVYVIKTLPQCHSWYAGDRSATPESRHPPGKSLKRMKRVETDQLTNAWQQGWVSRVIGDYHNDYIRMSRVTVGVARKKKSPLAQGPSIPSKDLNLQGWQLHMWDKFSNGAKKKIQNKNPHEPPPQTNPKKRNNKQSKLV